MGVFLTFQIQVGGEEMGVLVCYRFEKINQVILKKKSKPPMKNYIFSMTCTFYRKNAIKKRLCS